MKTEDLVINAERITKENKALRLVIPMLLVLIFAMGMWMTSIKQTVVIVPPTMTGEVEIAVNTASRDYKKAWGMYVASLIGNVDAKNVDIVSEGIINMVDMSIKSQFEKMLADQILLIKKRNLRTSFSVSRMTYEPKLDKVYVTGKRTLHGAAGKDSQSVTFEFIFKIRNYTPVITHMDLYNGGAKLGDK